MEKNTKTLASSGLAVKWGIIFTVASLIWDFLEEKMGYFDEKIDQHAYVGLFFFPIAILLYFLALREIRNKSYNGRMTWRQGFGAGILMTLIIGLLTPLAQYIHHNFIAPDFFPKMIQMVTESGKMNLESAQSYFNLRSYIMQSLLFSLSIGVVTAAIMAFITKTAED